MSKLVGEQQLMRIFIGKATVMASSLVRALVELCAREGFACTVLRHLRFWRQPVYHTQKLLDLSADLPMVIEVVDSQKIAAVMRRLSPDGGGMITLEKARDPL